MNRRVVLVLAGVVCGAAGAGGAGAKGEKVAFKTYTRAYFESNKSGLKDRPASYLAFTEQKAFDRVLRPRPPLMREKPTYLPRDVFASKLVVAVIKRGDRVWDYKVEKVTADGGTLYVQYRASGKGGGGSATFASPLIVTVDRGKYTSVVFIENGKKAGTARVSK
jgi:hypothetical protein